jgi:hypothetical protein
MTIVADKPVIRMRTENSSDQISNTKFQTVHRRLIRYFTIGNRQKELKLLCMADYRNIVLYDQLGHQTSNARGIRLERE